MIASRLIGAALALALTMPVYGDMLISPTRGLLGDDKRSETLTLRNTSDGPRTYRLEWQDKRARPGGGYDLIGEDDDAWPSAQEMIRHSPRQITVGPDENQSVRLSYRPPSDLAPGEYRSHLLLKVLPDESEPSATIESTAGGEDQVGIQLFMQMSFSLPIVVRHQMDELPEVAIEDVSVLPAESDKAMRLGLTLSRTGAASTYGRLLVEMQEDANSEVEVIGRRNELAIYHELDERRITVPLRDHQIPSGSWIRIAYEGSREYENHVWAERVFQSQ